MSVDASSPDVHDGHYRHYQGIRPGSDLVSSLDVMNSGGWHPLVNEGVGNTVFRVLDHCHGDSATALGALMAAARAHRADNDDVCALYLESCRALLFDMAVRAAGL